MKARRSYEVSDEVDEVEDMRKVGRARRREPVILRAKAARPQGTAA